MRVAFVDRKGAHAIWRLMHAIAESLIAAGDDVSIYRFDDGQQREPIATPEGCDVVDIAVPPKRWPWDVIIQQRAFTRSLTEQLRTVRPDVVHTNFCIPGSAARKVVHQRFQIPVVTTYHELYGSMNAINRFQLRATEPFADRLVYISRTVARSFGRSDVAPQAPESARHRVIYNGVDWRKISGISAQVTTTVPGRIVSAGRLMYVKGHDVLIRALPAIRAAIPHAHLELIGTGPEEKRLKDLAAGLNLSDHIQFRGWMDHEEVIREMASAQVLVMPSRATQEGFGLVLAESMACGTPVVASRIPVFEELVGTDGTLALLFEEAHPESLAEAVESTLEQESESRSRVERAQKLVETQYSLDSMTTNYRKLYKSLCAHVPVT